MQSLKSASYLALLLIQSQRLVMLLLLVSPLWVCREPAVDHFITGFQTSHLKNKSAAALLGCVSSSVGIQLGTRHEQQSMNRPHSCGLSSLSASEPGSSEFVLFMWKSGCKCKYDILIRYFLLWVGSLRPSAGVLLLVSLQSSLFSC